MVLWPRYQKMRIGPLGVAHLHKRNPWVAMACSIALPGLGHVYCGAYLRGLILMTWEILVNQRARLNLAIVLTLLGHFDKAQAVISYEWALLYPLFYAIAILGSYRVAVDLNKLTELEQRQPVRQFAAMSLGFMDTVHLSRRSPRMAAFLSLTLGGAGHLYNGQIIKAVVLMGWHIAIWHNAGLNSALIATLHGDWSEVHRLVDYQWLAFLPSIHLFNTWNAYGDAVELNKLYEEEADHFLCQVTSHGVCESVPPGTTQCDW